MAIEIHREKLNPGGSNFGYYKALWGYAKEILGDEWEFVCDDDAPLLQLYINAPSGMCGWQKNAASNGWYIISDGYKWTQFSNYDTGMVGSDGSNFTGVVWTSDGGSVGIGYQDDNGRDITTCLLAKFSGSFNGNPEYMVTHRAYSSGCKFLVRGNADIAPVNTYTGNSTGSGVWLHPLVDPGSGLISTDIYGARSLDAKTYGTGGVLVRHGDDTYMSVAGSCTEAVNNLLFVKM